MRESALGRADDPLTSGVRSPTARDFDGLGGLFVRHGDRSGDAVALTFDDGPAPATAEVAEILESNGARGTFFLVGEKVRGHEELLRRMVGAGHELGNHSSHHGFFPSAADIEATSSLLRAVTGQAPRLYRPPFGAIDTTTARAVQAAGMTSVSWDVDSDDVFPVYVGLEPREVYRNVVACARPGSIVLMHDGQAWSRAAEALGAICATLAARGLRLVTVSELLREAGAARSPDDGERTASGAGQGRRREVGPDVLPDEDRLGDRRSGGRASVRGTPRRKGSPSPWRLWGRLRARRNGVAAVPESWKLPAPPLTDRELISLAPAEVVETLRRWPTSSSPQGAAEGLARIFARRVISTPGEFLALAESFLDVDPLYLRVVLESLVKAVENGFPLDWETALTLVETAIERSGETPAGASGGGHAAEGHEAATEAARLVARALAADQPPPEALDERLWLALDRLSWLPAVASEPGDERARPDEHVRALAVLAIVEYAFLLRRRTGGEVDLSSTPRVRDNLDAHLDPEREPSPAVRGMFARELARLLTLDRHWLTERIEAILPHATDQRALRDAAWSEHLAWGRLHPELATLLRPHYERAIGALPAPAAQRRGLHNDPGRIVARKLARLYLVGALDLSDGALVERFVERAAADELAYFVRFLGILVGEEAEVGEDTRRRLAELWEVVGQRVARRAPEDRRLVLSHLGFWYVMGGLDRRWLERELRLLMTAGIPPEPGFRVMEQVAARAGEDPARAVELASLFVEAVDDEWLVVAASEHLARISAAGRAAGEEEARRRAAELDRRVAPLRSHGSPLPPTEAEPPLATNG